MRAKSTREFGVQLSRTISINRSRRYGQYLSSVGAWPLQGSEENKNDAIGSTKDLEKSTPNSSRRNALTASV